LINETIEAPLQFPKNRKMIFQLREALFASEKIAFKVRKLSTASRVGFAFLDLREQRHHGPSRLCNPGSKSSKFGFCF
jgi:hypothetical protein